GDVVFEADENLNTLSHFRHRQELKADNGAAGAKRQKHGKSGQNLVVKVPVGTIIYRDDQLLVDLASHGQQQIVAYGGDGGFGNAHFKSSTRQTPRVAELGEPGDSFEAKLELKLLADVGLVGFPNAGKSTFLSVVTNAKPEIADYAFTTLTPNLGVADIDDASLLIADIPGLIEGAAAGKGLGDQFLRHVERTAVLLHLIDVYQDDLSSSYQTIRKELADYDPKLAELPEIVALTKTEGLDETTINQALSQLQPLVKPETPLLAISARAHQGLESLLRELATQVQASREASAELEDEAPDDIPVIGLNQTEQGAGWQVVKTDDGFRITGSKIEKFARRTDFGNIHSLNRLRDIIQKMGIAHELNRQGAEPSSKLTFGDHSNSLTLQEVAED
ncbi:MAG TPA: GTPase ObgE, partial [Candidatus Saccharimonadales bacterium]|nr:GTPase ObgE [Candidatus Saccharimonadales bacterium]